MLKDLANFRNTVVYDDTCEDKPSKLSFGLLHDEKRQCHGFCGYQIFHLKGLYLYTVCWELLRPIFGAKKSFNTQRSMLVCLSLHCEMAQNSK